MKNQLLSLALLSTVSFAGEVNISALINSEDIKSNIINNNNCYPQYVYGSTEKQFIATKGAELLEYKLRYDKYPNFNIYGALQKDFEKTAQANLPKDKDILCVTDSFENFVKKNKQDFKASDIDVVKISSKTTEFETNIHRFGEVKVGAFVDNSVKVIKLAEKAALNKQLKIGDKILEVNGNKIKSVTELNEALNSVNIGDKYTLKVLSGKQTKTIDIVSESYIMEQNDFVISKTNNTLKIMPYGFINNNVYIYNTILKLVSEKQYKTIQIDTSHLMYLGIDSLLNLVAELTQEPTYLGIKGVGKVNEFGILPNENKMLKNTKFEIILPENATSSAKLFAYLMKYTDTKNVKIVATKAALKQTITNPKMMELVNDFLVFKPKYDETYIVGDNKNKVEISNKEIGQLLKAK